VFARSLSKKLYRVVSPAWRHMCFVGLRILLLKL